jgi:DnaJ domain
MAAADMAAWRRQNSDPLNVEVLLTDGSRVSGVIMLSRDKTLREFMNVGTEAFFDFDCKRDGAIIIAKVSVRQLRAADAKKKDDQLKIDALAARQAELEKADPYKILGAVPGADAEALRKAYIAKARAYHPDRFADSELPSEVMQYLNAMTRRINQVYDDLSDAAEAAKKAR